MQIITKQKIKVIKKFIISPILEKLILITYISVVPLMAYYHLFGNRFPDYFYGSQSENFLQISAARQVQTQDQAITYIKQQLAPSYFTTTITPNKPLFPLYIFYNKIANSGCFQESNVNVDQSCSMISPNFAPQSSQFANLETLGELSIYQITDVVTIGKDSVVSSIDFTQLSSDGVSIISAQSIYLTPGDFRRISFDINFEIDGGKRVRNVRYSYALSTLDIGSNSTYFILFSLFIIQMVFSTLKVFFEFSIFPQKYTYVGHFCHFVLEYSYVALFALAFRAQEKIYQDSIEFFIEYDNQISNQMNAQMILNLIFVFYPFRVFTFISNFKQAKPWLHIMIVLYRTVRVIALLLFVGLVSWVTYALGLYMLFKTDFYQTNNYGDTLLNYPNIDLSRIYTASRYSLLQESSDFAHIGWVINNALFYFLCLVILVVFVDVTRRAYSTEMPLLSPQEAEVQEIQEDLQGSFDKFLNNLANNLNSKNKDMGKDILTSNQKMIIWLKYSGDEETEIDEVEAEVSNRIRLMVFNSPEEVEDFLKLLFKLKPNLLNSKSGDKFRICVETRFEKGLVHQKNIEILLDWLKDMGSRTPFLLYLQNNLDRETYVKFRKKYQDLYACDDLGTVLKFCRMEEHFDNPHINLVNTSDGKYELLDMEFDMSYMDDLQTGDEQ